MISLYLITMATFLLLLMKIFDLMGKNPDDFEIKTFAIEGVKLDIFNSYRLFLKSEIKREINQLKFY